MLKIRPILIYAFILIALATNAQGTEKHALLIGINDYRGTDLDSLQGCVNDVELGISQKINYLKCRVH